MKSFVFLTIGIVLQFVHGNHFDWLQQFEGNNEILNDQDALFSKVLPHKYVKKSFYVGVVV